MADDQPTVTRLSKKWLLKMWIFCIVLLLLGMWGVWDATYVYPRKGQRHAKFMLMEYLTRLDDSGRLLRDADVEDPVAALNELNAQDQLSPDSIESARKAWLTSLSRIYSLRALTVDNQKELDRRTSDPTSPPRDTATMFAQPSALLGTLKLDLGTQSVPSPLNAYDIPFQYALVALGFGGGAALIGLMGRCSRRRYRYDPVANILSLPDGRSFSPEQITIVDKSLWHKYFVQLTVEGFGSPLKLDLLRYEPLERWVLEMEKLHPNYEPPEADEGASEASAGDSAAENEPPAQV